MYKEFIWDSKKLKIKHSTLIGHYEDGCFRDVDLPAKFKSIKFLWIKKMLDKSNFHPWIAVADKILKPLGRIDNFHTNFQLSLEFQSVLKIISEFYKDLIGIWRMPLHRVHTITKPLEQQIYYA